MKITIGPIAKDATGPIANLAFSHRHGQNILAHLPTKTPTSRFKANPQSILWDNITKLRRGLLRSPLDGQYPLAPSLPQVAAYRPFLIRNAQLLRNQHSLADLSWLPTDPLAPSFASARIFNLRGRPNLLFFGNSFPRPPHFGQPHIIAIIREDANPSLPISARELSLITATTSRPFRPLPLTLPPTQHLIWVYQRFTSVDPSQQFTYHYSKPIVLSWTPPT